MNKIAINGFGRIGRLTLRALLKYHSDIPVGAINTSASMDASGWTTLFKYDSTYGKLTNHIEALPSQNEHEIGRIKIDDVTIPLLAERDPEKIPWGNYEVHTVIDSTGAFRSKEEAEKHLKSGVQKVIISAPPKDNDIPIIVLPLNKELINQSPIISNGSCTTYSIAGVLQILEQAFGIEKATLTTVHAFTSDQRLLDGSHPKDIRRARSAPHNIIPTSSGAADSIVAVIPSLKGKFQAYSLRVPVITGSISDSTVVVKRPITKEEVNEAIQQQSLTSYKGIIEFTKDPIVSSDIIGNDHSAVIDGLLTDVIDQTTVKVFSWYDNEWSYALRLVELARMLVN